MPQTEFDGIYLQVSVITVDGITLSSHIQNIDHREDIFEEVMRLFIKYGPTFPDTSILLH